MMRTKRDVSQIQKFEHDENSNAKRVKLIDTEMGIELSHLDGDSVTVHPEKLSVSSLGVKQEDKEIVPEIKCSSLKRIKLYVQTVSGLRDCDIALEVSPIDSGDVWYNLCTVSGQSEESQVLDICARRLRIVKRAERGNAELNVHLVGQS